VSSRSCSSPRPHRLTAPSSARSTSSGYRLLVLNNFIGGFLFLPLTLLRIQERSRLFASITFLRSFGTVLVRLVLVIGLRYGVVGLVLADVIITTALVGALAPTMRQMLAWRFSRTMLDDLLAYGCPTSRMAFQPDDEHG
jgi:hypothetical protein